MLAAGNTEQEYKSEAKVKNVPDEKIELINLFGVQVDPKERKIMIPAKVNMTQGLVEYVLVHDTGKTHESLFKTSIKAEHLNAALLLLLPKKRLPSVRSLHENQIGIQIRYEDPGGNVKVVNVDRWIKNSLLEKPMKPGPWGYLGSRVEENVFIASRDGSLVAVREDSDAVVGNPRPESSQDDIWEANMPKDIQVGQNLTVMLTVRPLGKDL